MLAPNPPLPQAAVPLLGSPVTSARPSSEQPLQQPQQPQPPAVLPLTRQNLVGSRRPSTSSSVLRLSAGSLELGGGPAAATPLPSARLSRGSRSSVGLFRGRGVTFAESESGSVHRSVLSIPPYSEIYGAHPGSFEFGPDGRMVPASERGSSLVLFATSPEPQQPQQPGEASAAWQQFSPSSPSSGAGSPALTARSLPSVVETSVVECPATVCQPSSLCHPMSTAVAAPCVPVEEEAMGDTASTDALSEESEEDDVSEPDVSCLHCGMH